MKIEKLKCAMAPRDGRIFHPGYCLELLANAKEAAKKHPTDLAWRALDAIRSGNADESAQALDAFMRFMAPEVEVALAEEIRNPHAGQFRPYAAGLYLYGVSAALWKGKPDVLRLARTLYSEDDAPKPKCRTNYVKTNAMSDTDFQDTMVKLQARRIIAREEAVIALKQHGDTIRDVLLNAAHDPNASERNRLLAIEKVALGVKAGFWAVPPEWKS